MKYIVGLVLSCLSLFAWGEPEITEDLLKSISNELRQSIESQDSAIIKKYLYPGTTIIIDMDPSPSAGKTEIPYDKYLPLIDLSYSAMKDAEIHEEILSINIDKEKNQGTIEEKVWATLNVLGIKVQDVSISTTTYGIVDGEVKALHAEDELISSGPVE